MIESTPARKRRFDTIRDIVSDVGEWLHLEKLPVLDPVEAPVDSGFTLTGQSLIDQIARCIELGQPVLLEGPRGCGKSYCVRAGFKKAVVRGLVPRQALVPVQGNREIPRDYLAEDDIAFHLEPVSGSETISPYAEEDPNAPKPKMEVWPGRRNAPLFRLARRRLRDGTPVKSPGTDRVLCRTKDGADCDRFVLFLDEINRFSDGVLDSLLGLLEERTAILAGDEYQLPVTVCMTMNPPGYDASARKLSPPLAARIGRTYRLSTPDIDTMCDLIVEERLRKLSVERRLQREKLNAPATEQEVFPELQPPDSQLLRRASLATLCLWGDVSRYDDRSAEPDGSSGAGLEYLTPESRSQLKAVQDSDHSVSTAMRTISGLCRYGPDGRAIADWTVSAAAAAISDAAERGERHATIKAEHFRRTATKTLAHKMYDSFSSASRPDLTMKKEEALRTVVSKLINRDVFSPIVRRHLDNARWVADELVRPLLRAHDSRGESAINVARCLLRDAFIWSRVTRNEELEFWSRSLNSSSELNTAFAESASGIDVFYPAGQSADSVRARFCDSRFDDLCRALARLDKAVLFLTRTSEIARLMISVDDSSGLARAGDASHADDGLHDRLSRMLAEPGLKPKVAEAFEELDSIARDRFALAYTRTFERRLDQLVSLLRNDSPTPSNLGQFESSVPILKARGRELGHFVRQDLGPVRAKLSSELLERSFVKLIGAQAFVTQINSLRGTEGAHQRPDEVLKIADLTEELCLCNSDACGELYVRLNQLLSSLTEPIPTQPFIDYLVEILLRSGDDSSRDRARLLRGFA